MIRAKRKNTTKWHANREAIYIYMLFTMEQQEGKRNNKQETDYNKILVGARTRDRKQIKEEMIINSRLNGSSLIWSVFFLFFNLISTYTIQPVLCNTHHD